MTATLTAQLTTPPFKNNQKYSAEIDEEQNTLLKQAVEFRQGIPTGTLGKELPHVNQCIQCSVVLSCPQSPAAVYFCITKLPT